MQEIWKDIKGYEGLYQVSNLGKIKNKDNMPLHLNTNTYGYKHVSLSKEGKSKTVPVHKIVATAFIENRDNKPQINHRDGDKTNNKVENLEWTTQKLNNIHAIKTNLRKTRVVKMYDKNDKYICSFKNRMEIDKFFNKKIDQSSITRCCNGKRKSAYNYKWRYEDEKI